MASSDAKGVRPLRRVAPGYWETRDRRFRFLLSFPPNPSWYVYARDDDEPLVNGSYEPRLSGAVEWLLRELRAGRIS